MPSSIAALIQCPLEFSLGYECEREHLLIPVENLVLKDGHHRLLPFFVLYFTVENGQWKLTVLLCTPPIDAAINNGSCFSFLIQLIHRYLLFALQPSSWGSTMLGSTYEKVFEKAGRRELKLCN